MRNAFDPHCAETGPNALRPELMSDSERLDEAAEILARGVVRLRQRREGPRARIDNTMVKALARAHRWKKLLDSGRYQTVQDLAEAEKINPSYIARVLRLTLLAPDVVEAILDGRQPAGMQLDDLLAPFPVEWHKQIASLQNSWG